MKNIQFQNTNFVKNVQKIMGVELRQYKPGSDKKPRLTEAKGTDQSVRCLCYTRLFKTHVYVAAATAALAKALSGIEHI